MEIYLYYIVKIQAVTIRLFEAQDEDYPDYRVVRANERSIEKWLDRITKDQKQRKNILEIIENENWNFKDGTFKPICEKLRDLGYTIIEGKPPKEKK